MNMEQPTPQTVEYGVKYDVGGLGGVVTIANVLVTVILVVAMYADSHSATIAVLCGIGFFVISTSLTLLTLSGALTAIVVNRQKEVTARRLNGMQFEVYKMQMATLSMPQPMALLPDMQREEYAAYDAAVPVMEPLPPPPVPSRFVPAVDRDVARDARLWALSLYKDGQPDPDKVLLTSTKESAGRLRVPKPPSSAALEFLLSKNVLAKMEGGYRLNVGRFGTSARISELMNLHTSQ